MWLLPYVGYFIISRFDQWWWIGFGNPYVSWQKIAISHFEWTGAQLPAAAFAGLIVGLGGFRHPLRVGFWTVVVFQLFFIAVHLPDLGWVDIQGSEHATLMLAHLSSVFMLAGTGLFVAWLLVRRYVSVP